MVNLNPAIAALIPRRGRTEQRQSQIIPFQDWVNLNFHGIAYPLGALLAAALAGAIGVRGGIFIGWAGMAASILLLVFSPLPRVRTVSDVPGLEG